MWHEPSIAFQSILKGEQGRIPFGDNNAVFCQVPTQGDDQLRPLTGQRLMGAEQDRMALLFLALDLDEPHAGLAHGRGNRRGVIGVVLWGTLDKRLHVDRRHQLHVMTQFRRKTPPVVAGCAGFHGDKTRRMLRQ